MTRTALTAVLATAHGAVLTAPAALLALASRKGGLPWAHGVDLVVVSAAIAAVHAALVWRRLRRERRRPSFVDACIASLDALVVLALLATVLLFVVLGGLAPEHAAAVNKGWHVLATWAVLQALAVVTATAVRHGIFGWLRRGAVDVHALGRPR